MLFDLKHAFYAAAGAAVGAVVGYLLGLVLYIVVISASVFSTSTTIASLVASAGVYPLLFAILVAGIGFFSGWYISHTQDSSSTSTAITPDKAQSIVAAIDDLKETLIAQSKHTADAGPPKAPAATQ